MNKRITVLASVLGLALLAGLSLAAASAPDPVPAPAPQPGGPPADFHARMAEKLGLSADQEKKIGELRAAQRTEMQALGENKDLTPGARREKARAIFENYRTQIHAVLTPEQQKQADELRAKFAGHERGAGGEHRARGPESRGREMGRPPADPRAIIAMADRIKDRLAEQLQLTEEQRDKLEHLGRAYRAQQRELAKKHHEEMRAVLTPEQQKKADALKEKFHQRAGMRAGPERGHAALLGRDDEPAGPALVGLDFGFGGLAGDQPDNPPAPDTD